MGARKGEPSPVPIVMGFRYKREVSLMGNKKIIDYLNIVFKFETDFKEGGDTIRYRRPSFWA